MNPFFSICIPATNRENTIFKTLSSISNQTFNDFEVIISICNCEDNTEEQINLFFNGDEFKNNPFKYFIQKLNYKPKTVEDWNEPLKLSSGKYIAMLEGDDQFLPNHLTIAYKYLSKNPLTGLYFPGKKYKEKILTGKTAFSCLYSLKAIPAPSEAIFIASDGNKKFIYNINEYNYCPEIELYFEICLKNFSIYYSGEDGVIRDKTIKSRAKWKYYRDHFYIANKFKNNVTPKKYNNTYNEIKYRAIKSLIYDFYKYKSIESKQLKKELINKFGIVNYYVFLIICYIKVFFIFIKKRMYLYGNNYKTKL